MKRLLVSICIVFTAIVSTVAFYGSKTRGAEQSPAYVPVTASPDPTPVPTPASSPVRTPAPTAIPTATPVPFSFYAPTTRMSFAELIGDNENYDLPLGYPAPDTYRIVVDKLYQVVIVYTKADDGTYSVPVRYMLCSTGPKTPEGIFQMKRYRVRFGYFQNDGTFGQYWSLINGRIYFHSILYTERNNGSSYIDETYRLLGTAASHGCIRLTVPDARFLFYNAAYGTEVEIRAGDPADSGTASIRAQLVLAEAPDEHLFLKPGTLPDTDNWHIETVPLEVPYLEGTQKGQE